MKFKRNLDHVPSNITLGFVYDDLFIGVLFQMKNCLLVLSLLESTISVIRKSFHIWRRLSSANSLAPTRERQNKESSVLLKNLNLIESPIFGTSVAS